MLGEGLIGLTLQGLVEQSRGERLGDLGGESLQGSEGGAPGRPLGTPEMSGQVFGGGDDDGTQFGRDLYLLGGFCHLPPLTPLTRQGDHGLLW